jgi:hypothetical protein
VGAADVRSILAAASPPPLPTNLNDGLKRLKVAAMRRWHPS